MSMDYEDVERILIEKRKRFMAEVKKIDTILNSIGADAPKLGRPAGKSKRGGKRKMSAAGRAAIAAAQKARWAKIKAKPAKKRKMSAAARARIAAFQKARWAKIKAAKK